MDSHHQERLQQDAHQNNQQQHEQVTHKQHGHSNFSSLEDQLGQLEIDKGPSYQHQQHELDISASFMRRRHELQPQQISRNHKQNPQTSDFYYSNCSKKARKCDEEGNQHDKIDDNMNKNSPSFDDSVSYCSGSQTNSHHFVATTHATVPTTTDHTTNNNTTNKNNHDQHLSRFTNKITKTKPLPSSRQKKNRPLITRTRQQRHNSCTKSTIDCSKTKNTANQLAPTSCTTCT